MNILNESLKTCFDAFLNTRNRKICFLRIGAVYHFVIRDTKLNVLELLEDEKVYFAVSLHCTVCTYTVTVQGTQCFSAHPKRIQRGIVL